MSLDAQIADFKLRRANIDKKKQELITSEQELNAWVTSTDIFKNFAKKKEALDKEIAIYKAEQKAAFGICDWEPSNVCDIITTIKKVSALD